MPNWPATISTASSGFEVALLQSSLNEISNLSLVVDGIFGNGTKSKVEGFIAAATK